MDVPKTFKPEENLDERTNELLTRKYQKIRNIRDLILKPEEINKDYQSYGVHSMTEKEFRKSYYTIEWDDIKNNLKAQYSKGYGPDLGIHVLEYSNREQLEQNFNNAYRELQSLNRDQEEHKHIFKILVVDQYAIVLRAHEREEEDLKRAETIYREIFGAKSLIKKREKISIHNHPSKVLIEKKQWFKLE